MKQLSLDGAVFAQQVAIEASTLRASFARATFRRGADIRLRWAEVGLEDSDFTEPSLLTPLPPRRTLDGKKAFLGWERPANGDAWEDFSLENPPTEFEPHVLSVRGARVAQLTLSGVDLRMCRFGGSHGLDQLRMERVALAQSPKGWRWIGWRPVRWTRRRTVAEENDWRHRQGRYAATWEQPAVKSGGWGDTKLQAGEIAGIYRELRKGREDAKDEPGATDFYYGEMEMRRHQSDAPRAERVIIWLYWLVSGYGLRASRALIALAVTILVLGAIPLALWGFRPDRSYGSALLFALQSSISLLRAPPTQPGHETAAGQVIEVLLRLLGPLFFGLALLALRGRVKR